MSSCRGLSSGDGSMLFALLGAPPVAPKLAALVRRLVLRLEAALSEGSPMLLGMV